jgi:hypothetical protein
MEGDALDGTPGFYHRWGTTPARAAGPQPRESCSRTCGATLVA